MAPEIVTKQEYSGPPADIWASCVLLFALLCGYFPYKGATDAELYERICSCESFPPEFLTKEAKDFLNGIFQYDPGPHPCLKQSVPQVSNQEILQASQIPGLVLPPPAVSVFLHNL